MSSITKAPYDKVTAQDFDNLPSIEEVFKGYQLTITCWSGIFLVSIETIQLLIDFLSGGTGIMTNEAGNSDKVKAFELLVQLKKQKMKEREEIYSAVA